MISLAMNVFLKRFSWQFKQPSKWTLNFDLLDKPGKMINWETNWMNKISKHKLGQKWLANWFE